MSSGETRYLLICNTSDGLVAQLNGIVVQLQFARRMGLQPIVYLHRRSYMFGGPNPYFEASQGPNVWDYYFEPIGPAAEELQALVKSGAVYTIATASELARLYRWDPRSWYMNPYGYYRSVENRADGPYPADWWAAQRDKARRLLNDGTVRFRASIVEQVDRFVATHFCEDTLGLQLRGSDKFDFGVGPNCSQKITPDMYYPHIDRYLREHPKCQRIFVATDQRQWLEELRKAYPDKVISVSERSLADSNENRFHDAGDKAARGGEVLLDLLMLSRCSYVLKCHAAVGEMALTLSPGLEFLDLNYANQPFEAKSRPLRALIAPVIRLACAAWGALAERGLSLAKVASVDGDEVLVGSPPRTLNIKTDANVAAPRAALFSARFVSDAFEWLLRGLGDRCFSYVPKAR